MDNTVKTFKSDTTCKSDISNTKVKNTKKPLKRRVDSKKELKESPKFKTEDNLFEKTNKNEGEPSLKRRKVQTDSIKKPKKETKSINDLACNWKDEEQLADTEGLSPHVAKNIIQLFKEENTIPFIARYRSHLTGDLTSDQLRKIKATYEYIQLVHKKAEQLIHQLQSNGSANPGLISFIQSARTVEELEFIGSTLKKDHRSLAERARALGLEPPALLLLRGEGKVLLESFVNTSEPELDDVNKVKLGIQHIIADVISKNAEVLALLKDIYSSPKVLLQSKFKKGVNGNDRAPSKYSLYGDFSQPVHTIQPHQTLAINRGESEKELTAKIIIPGSLWQPLKNFCRKKWLKSGSSYELRTLLFSASVDDAIKRLLEPLASRRIRAKLKADAQCESLNVFESNLRQLLMTRPFTGHFVMGIDPGFGHGCKVAVVSHTGEYLRSDVFYLHNKEESKKKLRRLLSRFGCKVIALGNGTGSRQTEELLTECIKTGIFKPLDVTYTVIDEQGVSIYSCSSTASEEFPGMDPKIVGAISLARRLQNPLSELVKVEPKHLGVGMYQHDVDPKKLESALDEVVSECVSFVGVDVNTASFYLLKRVAGLTAAKAKEIINYRKEVCSFKCREDLKKVKGIKTKTFLQCAGFIRVIPSTAKCGKHPFCGSNYNPLDETCLHPESYNIVLNIINQFGLNVRDLGSENFVKTIEQKTGQIAELAKYHKCSNLEVEFIINSLKKPKNFDMRCLYSGPSFRNAQKKLEDLLTGEYVNGVVRNIVTFGAFVDIGVGVDGLIHKSQMQNKSLQLNNRVKVQVMSTNVSAKKIELKLCHVIES